MKNVNESFEEFFEKQMKEHPLIVEKKNRGIMMGAYTSGIIKGIEMINEMYGGQLKSANEIINDMHE